MGAESFRRRKFDRDKLIWNADCGMVNAECEALDPLIAAEWSDELPEFQTERSRIRRYALAGRATTA